MIGKLNTTCKSLASRPKKDSSDVPAKQQVQKPSNKKLKSSTANDVLVIDLVTVKTKGRKSSSVMVSNSSNAPKMMEEKAQLGNTVETRMTNWSRTLREQNRPVLKQGLQQLAGQMQSAKHSRHENHERKEVRTVTETHQSRKYIRQDSRIFDEIPIKQMAKKSSEQTKTAASSSVPSATTIASSLESVEVTDKAVQCGGIFDCSNDKLGIYNPVRMLGILMQEMEGLVRDERSSKILTEMEQALLRIPKESGKLPPDVLEKIALCTKLEAGMSQLEATSKELDAASTRLRKEKESLQQQVTKQGMLLEEGQQREKNAEMTIKKLKMELNESLKTNAENAKTIAALREENKSIERSQKLARDLRRELNEQIELAEQRYMEVQYLKLEKDKLLALSSYKDVMLNELRKKLKELQNHISEQLVTIRESGNQQVSVIHGGLACSSPTSTSSKNSLSPHSCPELSEISLSTVDGVFSKSVTRMNSGFNISMDEFEGKGVTDKAQSEFISLPGEETCHSVSLTHHQNEEERKSSIGPNTETNPSMHKIEWKLDEFMSAPNVEFRDTQDGTRRVDKENGDHRSKSKTRKSSSNVDNKQNRDDATKRSANEVDGKNLEVERCSGDPVSIKEQFQIMFQDIRRQSKFLVQSPPQDYPPHTEWSDSSLPTISVMSESNVA